MKKTFALLVPLIAACALIPACRSTSSADADSFRTIARGYQSGIVGPVLEVARTQSEWDDLWARHTSTQLPRPEIPAVDFNHEMVVFAGAGARPTTGYGFEIERIVPQVSGDILVEAIERQPKSDAILPQVVSQPFHMIAMRKSGGEVRLSTAIQRPSSP